MVARKSMESQTEDPFTERIFALDNRRFYKGVAGEAYSSGLGFGIKLTTPAIVDRLGRVSAAALASHDSNRLESTANPGCHRERHGESRSIDTHYVE